MISRADALIALMILTAIAVESILVVRPAISAGTEKVVGKVSACVHI
jgi:hypothetical protein